jgi:aconitate hydratase
MGVLPLVLKEGTTWQSLGLKGDEKVTIRGVAEVRPRQVLNIEITRADGDRVEVPAQLRIDTLDELEYFRHGGILHYVLRNLVKQAA